MIFLVNFKFSFKEDVVTPIFESYVLIRCILASMLGCLFVKDKYLNSYFLVVVIAATIDAAIYISKL